MSDKSRLCVQCGRYIAQDVLSTEDGPIHVDGCATYDELVREVARLRRIEEALEHFVDRRSAAYNTPDDFYLEMMKCDDIARAALADQPTEEE